jgi:hypothetical protein
MKKIVHGIQTSKMRDAYEPFSKQDQSTHCNLPIGIISPSNSSPHIQSQPFDVAHRSNAPLPIANHVNTALRTSSRAATTNMATTFSTECLTSSVRDTTSPDSSSISITTGRTDDVRPWRDMYWVEVCSLFGMYCINVSRFECDCSTATAYDGGASCG